MKQSASRFVGVDATGDSPMDVFSRIEWAGIL